MHLMHFLAIAAGGIRTALFSSGPPSLSFSGPSEMPGLPSFCGRLSLHRKKKKKLSQMLRRTEFPAAPVRLSKKVKFSIKTIAAKYAL